MDPGEVLLAGPEAPVWEQLAWRLQLVNTFQWHEEDRSRAHGAGDRVLAAVIALELARSVLLLVEGHRGIVQVRIILIIGLLAAIIAPNVIGRIDDELTGRASVVVRRPPSSCRTARPAGQRFSRIRTDVPGLKKPSDRKHMPVGL